ncbi:MAG: hypothetical protein HFH80_12995 [Lachnospiraceae bacterium]|nr:hypothetical protein [Lachnospiraceae bacterium]
MKWKQCISRYRWQLAVLALVLLVQCFYIGQKQGYHMDELLTFELGNAEYNPWIVPTQPVGRLAKFMQQEIYGDSLGETLGNLKDTLVDVLRNRGDSKLLSYRADVYEEPVWITREQFHEYITVGERDGFNYLSVYFNVKDDNHPPLYFMLVHTMSSLFRDRISPWMGCIFNLGAVLGCCVLLFALGGLLARHGFMDGKAGEYWGLCGALLYGCSSGAIATTLFIRMYGVMTLLCILSLYLHLEKWLGSRDRDFRKKNGLLILVTALGFWTQYFFLFYCLLLALVTVVALYRNGRKRETFCYIRSMVTAAVVGVGLYPFGVKHILTSGRGVEAIGNLLGGLAGYGERLISFGGILLQRTFGREFPGLAVLALLWAALGIATVHSQCRVRREQEEKGFRGSPAGERVGMEKKSRRKLWWMLILPPAGYFLLAARMSPYMVDRYIMPVFPFAAMAVAGFVTALYRRLNPLGRRALTCVVVLLAWVSFLTYDGEYLYKGYRTQLRAAEQYRDLPCICVYEGYGFYDNLLEFETYDRTLLVKPAELASRQDLSQLQEVVVLYKSSVSSESREEIREILSDYGLEPRNALIRDSVYGDVILYYEKESSD